jgi:addiction module HigA family antidote
MRKIPPPHPGETLLEDFMKPLGLTANRVATDLRVPATRIGEIIHGRRAISAETALRLGRYFGTSPQFWMNLQQAPLDSNPGLGLLLAPTTSLSSSGEIASHENAYKIAQNTHFGKRNDERGRGFACSREEGN